MVVGVEYAQSRPVASGKLSASSRHMVKMEAEKRGRAAHLESKGPTPGAPSHTHGPQSQQKARGHLRKGAARHGRVDNRSA
jgi:hypothetical protein